MSEISKYTVCVSDTCMFVEVWGGVINVVTRDGVFNVQIVSLSWGVRNRFLRHVYTEYVRAGVQADTHIQAYPVLVCIGETVSELH